MKRRKIQAVIYKERQGKKSYLILHRTLHWSGWELLKETIEKKESYEETLRRGIKEEIGVIKIKIEKRKSKRIVFNKEAEIVYIFLVRISPEEKIDITKEQEHDRYKWATKKEALELLYYNNAKEVLKELLAQSSVESSQK